MALINCRECGKEVSDKAENCPNCGCVLQKQEGEEKINVNGSELEMIPDNDEIVESVKKESRKKKWFVLCGVIVLVTLSYVGYRLSDLGQYNAAKRLYKNENYHEAAKKFGELGNYKDAKNLKRKARHKYAVAHDTTEPWFENIPSEIEINYGEEINFKNWCKEKKITVDDDVTYNMKYKIDDTDVDTTKKGTYKLELLAEDEAGNKETEIIRVVVKEKYGLDQMVGYNSLIALPEGSPVVVSGIAKEVTQGGYTMEISPSDIKDATIDDYTNNRMRTIYILDVNKKNSCNNRYITVEGYKTMVGDTPAVVAENIEDDSAEYEEWGGSLPQ